MNLMISYKDQIIHLRIRRFLNFHLLNKIKNILILSNPVILIKF